MFISWLHFLFMLLLTGTAIRLIQVSYPDSSISKALSVVY